MTAKEQGLPEGLEADIDAMRDVYLSPSQRGAYERILARAATYKSALASDTGERGVGVNPEIIGNPDAAAWAAKQEQEQAK